jgi:hypothetical protein
LEVLKDDGWVFLIIGSAETIPRRLLDSGLKHIWSLAISHEKLMHCYTNERDPELKWLQTMMTDLKCLNFLIIFIFQPIVWSTLGTK